MAAGTGAASRVRVGPRRGLNGAVRRDTTETKPSFRTSELYAYIATAIAVLIAGASTDNLQADKVWLYVSVLTVGYMISRGLAKAGSFEHDRDGVGDRRRPDAGSPVDVGRGPLA
jgi:hypothetical protein